MSAAHSSALWQLSAYELAGRIRSGELSAREVVEAHIARMHAVNPKLNAIVRPLDDEALKYAAQADAKQARGEELGPLHGVPVSIKANVDQAGHPTDNGVVAYKDVIATEDSPTARNFKQSGAIIIGRTNTPAFSMRWFTANDLHGKTRNPWHPDHTPGGSSGGAASSVAAGITPIANGNDIAGSVRYPAYCCGLVGLRPSFGRVPAYNPSAAAPGRGAGRPISAQLMAVQGPLTRHVCDARIALAVMSGRDPRDPKWVDVPLRGPPPKRPLRVALVSNPSNLAVEPHIAKAVQKAGCILQAAGYRVEEVEPPELEHVVDLWSRIGLPDVIDSMLPAIEEHGDEAIKKAVKYWRSGAADAGPAEVLEALTERDRCLHLWSVFLEDYALILTPSSAEQAFVDDLDIGSQSDYERIWSAQWPQLAVPVLGLPAIAVPTGEHNGLPMGVQLIAARYREDLCLDAAEILEAHQGPAAPIDPRF